MPTPGQMAAQASMPPELLAKLEGRNGSLMGGGPMMVTQNEGALAMRVQELSEEIRELRRMLFPPNSVILTGPEVAEHFKRLRQ